MVPRIKESYYKKVLPELIKRYKLKNKNQVPVLEKIVVNVGVGEAKDNPKSLTSVAEELAFITGQKALITRAKKSISNFKIRQGIPIGAKVTLRGDKMWEFFDRLVNIALPRVRDFRGLNLNSFDKFNNYSIGIKEQIIFPEIEYDKVDKIHGMDITFVIKNNRNNKIVKDFLTGIGMPFRAQAEALKQKEEAKHHEEALKKAEALKQAAEDRSEEIEAQKSKDLKAKKLKEEKSEKEQKPDKDKHEKHEKKEDTKEKVKA